MLSQSYRAIGYICLVNESADIRYNVKSFTSKCANAKLKMENTYHKTLNLSGP